MEIKSNSSSPQRHPGLLLCDLIHALLLSVLVPALCAALIWTYGQYKTFTNPANWTMTTADVLNVVARKVPRGSRQLELNIQMQVNGGPVFDDCFPPMKAATALAFKKEIEETHKVPIYRSVSAKPDYALSYVYAGHMRWMSALVFGGVAGLLLVAIVVSSWIFRRKRITFASGLRGKFARTAQHTSP